MKTTTSYTEEFRQRAVQLAEESSQPVGVTARELGVNESTLHTLINKRRRQQRSTAPGALSAEGSAELDRLRKENKRLREEREILKKAAAYFARESL